MERLVIQTRYFEPKDDEIETFKSSFGHALGRGPSDATLCCCIIKEHGKFVLNMRIHSSHGHFPIHVQHEDLEKVISYTISSMNKSFQDWHNDPSSYGKNHKMGDKPCYHSNGEIYKCPLGFYSNKKFEKNTDYK